MMTDSMRNMTDDELLSAYIDGELPNGEADALTERLAAEPELMQRLEALRSADGAVRDVYAAIEKTPLPASVLGLFDESQSETPAGNVIAFPARGMRRFFEVPVAIAASLALVAGFLGATLLRQDALSPPPGDGFVAGPVAAGSELHDLLESAPSGRSQDLSGRPAEVILTFADAGGDWCRQLRVGAEGRSIHGVACRRDAGWQLEAIALGDTGAPDGQFGTASGTTPGLVRAAVDALIGDDAPLEADQENRLIAEGWRKTAD